MGLPLGVGECGCGGGGRVRGFVYVVSVWRDVVVGMLSGVAERGAVLRALLQRFQLSWTCARGARALRCDRIAVRCDSPSGVFRPCPRGRVVWRCVRVVPRAFAVGVYCVAAWSWRWRGAESLRARVVVCACVAMCVAIGLSVAIATLTRCAAGLGCELLRGGRCVGVVDGGVERRVWMRVARRFAIGCLFIYWRTRCQGLGESATAGGMRRACDRVCVCDMGMRGGCGGGATHRGGACHARGGWRCVCVVVVVWLVVWWYDGRGPFDVGM